MGKGKGLILAEETPEEFADEDLIMDGEAPVDSEYEGLIMDGEAPVGSEYEGLIMDGETTNDFVDEELIMDGEAPVGSGGDAGLPENPLFEDGLNCRENRRVLGLMGGGLILVGALFGTGFGLSTGPLGGATCVFSILTGIFTVTGLFLLIARSSYRPFRILGDGISFTRPSTDPFLPFDDMDFIIKADYDGVNIYRKGPRGRPISIVSAYSGHWGDERVADWPRFYAILKACMMQAHPDRPDYHLVREYRDVQWSPEALDALENEVGWYWPESPVARGISEEVLKQGRYWVGRADLWDHLKGAMRGRSEERLQVLDEI